nr:hypothetical protein [Streptomyces sp.]
MEGQPHGGGGGVPGARVGGVVRDVHVPLGAAVVVPGLVAGDLRAHRELDEQRVQQVHRQHLVAARRRLEDGAQPGPYRPQPGDIGVRRAPGRLLALPEERAYGIHRGQGVRAAAGLLAVDQAHGEIRVISQFHLWSLRRAV